MSKTSDVYIVAGNGLSLNKIEPGRVLSDDVFIRTNNFFFEPDYYLGRRIDYAFMGGDPRVSPFMFETLHQCREDYSLHKWTSHDARVIRAGQKRFAENFQPMAVLDPALRAEVDSLVQAHGKQPTTGAQAALFACAMGAKQIILAGFDLYSKGKRYPFEPGPNFKSLMGQDIGNRAIDTRLHDATLDREILLLLARKGGVEIFCATEASALSDLFPLAPMRHGEAVFENRSNPPTDWASWVGLYPIGLLKLLRKGSAFVRK